MRGPPFFSVALDSHHWTGFKLHLVDDLMAIGEFSERSGLSAKRLRTYAAEGLLVPAAVGSGSGYRYYSPSQLADAQVIDALRQAGVPLADIRAFIRHPSGSSSMPGRDSFEPMRAIANGRSLLPATFSQGQRARSTGSQTKDARRRS